MKTPKTLFKTPEEYEEKFEEIMGQYYKLKESERYPGEHGKELARIWKSSRFYYSSISISLFDVSQHLPLLVLCDEEKIITHVTLNTRKYWGDIECAAFWCEGQTYREEPLYRGSNRYNCLTRTYIQIPRKEAIRIGFEADTSSSRKARFGDDRRALAVKVRALAVKVVPIIYDIIENEEW